MHASKCTGTLDWTLTASMLRVLTRKVAGALAACGHATNAPERGMPPDTGNVEKWEGAYESAPLCGQVRNAMKRFSSPTIIKATHRQFLKGEMSIGTFWPENIYVAKQALWALPWSSSTCTKAAS